MPSWTPPALFRLSCDLAEGAGIEEAKIAAARSPAVLQQGPLQPLFYPQWQQASTLG